MTSTISYSRTGSGEPIVLIHGIGHRREAWNRVPELLASDFDVINIDLPGHGRSPAPGKPAGYTITSYADQVEELLRELAVTQPHVAGNSLGGILALELAARGSVQSCAAFSPAGFWSKAELGLLAVNLLALKVSSYAPGPVIEAVCGNERLRAISMRSLYVHPEHLSTEEAIGDTYNLRRAKGFWPCFIRGIGLSYKQIPLVPSTIAWGEKDRLLLPRQAGRAARKLPSVTHVPLPDCGHVPMVDHPELIASVIRETTARVGVRQLSSVPG
ncbi:alpha/beta hydrolase [Allobranchiibius sp. GilTou38]|uniref:alpha/beta fold hydrolase n=1 Tax=Allobranchiibius sp. GilTou38 TaxID=2815210 RepID=UPI001AA13A64|nr:alpha/beta hydrolase [Allobranchiibius sp. GilTou38]MBO1767283.1 alpha/beta hydrolase [Allobranchiibius sp. GilTou38]